LKRIILFQSRTWPVVLGLGLAVIFGGTLGAWAMTRDLGLTGSLHEAAAEHADQDELMNLVLSGEFGKAFEEAFELGDELFETVFNSLDGVGAHVGQGQRFTRVPRADLTGPDEWANHFPRRETGPNAQSCNACHSQPFDDGAGSAASNVHRDPLHTGNLSSFIQRDTPHLFGIGAVQRVAEEMTEELHAIRDEARDRAMDTCRPTTRRLSAKGVDFGTIKATLVEKRRSPGADHGNPKPSDAGVCAVKVDTSGVKGVDADLVVRPFQWKGVKASIRQFNRDASHNELGMQPVEIVGDDLDGDFDGVTNEMTIGDQSAMAIYVAAQPRPTTRMELASLGLIEPLTADEVQAIERGSRAFQQVSCAQCHIPKLPINDPTFSEPSQNPNYRDAIFPAGQDPVSRGVDPSHPLTFDLTQHHPDNQVVDNGGNVGFRLGSLQKDQRGRAIAALYGDLKRHDMGPGLAEPIDEVGTGASVFLTENLWGVGSTAPYLHDGRATTLTEAIIEHGGEAASSRDAFIALPIQAQRDLIAFLNNLVLFKMEDEEGQ
jgi:hypothetical protein